MGRILRLKDQSIAGRGAYKTRGLFVGGGASQVLPLEKGGRKGFSHAEWGSTTSFEVVLTRGTKVLAIRVCVWGGGGGGGRGHKKFCLGCLYCIYGPNLTYRRRKLQKQFINVSVHVLWL